MGDIPVIMGITEEETAYFVIDDGRIPEPSDDAALTDAVHTLFNDLTTQELNELVRVYRAALPDADGPRLLVAVTTGHWIWRATQQQAEQKASHQQAPAFVYLFSWKEPFAEGSWAVHGGDVGFVFDEFEVPDYLEFNVDSTPVRAAAYPDGARYTVRDAMMDAWVNFARNGTPASPLFPTWPAYTVENRSVLRIDGQSHVVEDPWGPDVRRALSARTHPSDLEFSRWSLTRPHLTHDITYRSTLSLYAVPEKFVRCGRPGQTRNRAKEESACRARCVEQMDWRVGRPEAEVPACRAVPAAALHLLARCWSRRSSNSVASSGRVVEP